MHPALPIALLVPALLFGARAMREVARASALDAELLTAAVRSRHAPPHPELGQFDRILEELPSRPAVEQRESLRLVVRALREHVAAHADDGRSPSHPAVDHEVGGDPGAFPAPSRREHVLVARWIGELETLAAATEPDVLAFARRAQRLLGLFEAHLGAAEDVPLSCFDEPRASAAIPELLGR